MVLMLVGDLFSRIFGALKGTVTIAPGVDLTMPTHEKWDAGEIACNGGLSP